MILDPVKVNDKVFGRGEDSTMNFLYFFPLTLRQSVQFDSDSETEDNTFHIISFNEPADMWSRPSTYVCVTVSCFFFPIDRSKLFVPLKHTQTHKAADVECVVLHSRPDDVSGSDPVYPSGPQGSKRAEERLQRRNSRRPQQRWSCSAFFSLS